MAKKRRNGRPGGARRRLRVGPLAVWAVIAAVAGAMAFLIVYSATSGGGGDGGNGNDSFTAQVVETPSDASKGTPFQGGPRLYFPTESMDLGQVPFMKQVSESFDFKNVGDAPLEIQDVQVTMLEGCWPFEPVVGSTTIQPGEQSTISFDTHMMEGMGGPHLFEISVRTNDPVEPMQKLQVRAVFGP